ncbi:MAG: pantoate--beta-alanine ligase [Bacteroidota bacterium]|nr:pantoate--beta-alanine ligase [Bacteroidota bacterium]
MLKQNACDLVFVPEVDEMYPEAVTTKYDFGRLERVMEGKHRPGHFNGVAVVVKKLFDIVEPDRAFFGQKDFQQLLIIQKLVEKKNIPVKIVPCPTVREVDGLAMSSRNKRLSYAEREKAPFLYQTLQKAASMIPAASPEEVAAWGREQIEQHPKFKLEYFEVAGARELGKVEKFEKGHAYVICLAAHLGKVRLIDNVIINS